MAGISSELRGFLYYDGHYWVVQETTGEGNPRFTTVDNWLRQWLKGEDLPCKVLISVSRLGASRKLPVAG